MQILGVRNMFNLLNRAQEKADDQFERTRYIKQYPFNTSKDESHKNTNDFILVLECNPGFIVFERGEDWSFLKWEMHMDKAVEFAVDYARERILNYQA